MGEHSPCDALVPSIVADYAATQSIIPESFSSPEPPSFFSERDLDSTGWVRLDWVTDARIKAECIAAESRAESLISDSDDSVLWFSDYGTDWIKSIGTSGFHRPLSDADLVERIQAAWPRTRTCRWRFNWPGTTHAGASRLRTRLLLRVPLTRLARRRSVL